MEFWYKLFLKFTKKVNILQPQKTISSIEPSEDPDDPFTHVNKVRLSTNDNNRFVESDKDVYLDFPNVNDNNIHKSIYVIKHDIKENIYSAESTIRDTDDASRLAIDRVIDVVIKCDLTNGKTYCINGFVKDSPIRDSDMAGDMVAYSKTSGMHINRVIDDIEISETEEKYRYTLPQGKLVVIEVIIVKNNYIVNVIGGNNNIAMLAQANSATQAVLAMLQ